MQEVSHTEREAIDRFLGFASGVLTARDKVQMTMGQSRMGVFPQAEIAGLPGLRIASEDNEWLRLRRLTETRPENPPDHVAAFVGEAIANPDRLPEAVPAISRVVPIEKASDLEEAGLLRRENVSEVVERGKPDEESVRVTLLAEDCPEMRRDLEDWITKVWTPWAEVERPIRQSIKLYNTLFKLYSAIRTAETTPPEVIWGLGLASWKKDGHVIEMPIVEQSIDLDVEHGGDIVMLPREISPSLSLKPFLQIEIPGSDRLQATLQGLLRQIIFGDAPIDPAHMETIESILSTAAAQLDSTGRHISVEDLTEGEDISQPGPELRITSTWAIYARPRSSEARAQDINALRERVREESQAVPTALLGYVAPPSDEAVSGTADFGLDTAVLDGASSLMDQARPASSIGAEGMKAESASSKALEYRVYFFPLPYNTEQARIIDMLEGRKTGKPAPVVSVTGPPGTGKSHTIANLIAHAMATGKRVLVTARTPEAISVVREKLPVSLRKLAIASTGTDRDSTNQLRDAVQELSDEVIGLDAEAAHSERSRIERNIIECNQIVAEADRAIAAIARFNLETIEFDEQHYTPMELVERLQIGRSNHEWFTDRPKAAPPEGLKSLLERLASELPSLGPDIVYLSQHIPDPASIPGGRSLLEAHQHELVYANRQVPDYSTAPPMVRDTEEDETRAAGTLAEINALQDQLNAADAAVTGVARALGTGEIASEAIMKATRRLAEIDVGETMARVRYDRNAVPLADLIVAAERGAVGQKPAPGLFNRQLKRAVASVTTDEKPASSRKQWRLALDVMRLERDRQSLVGLLAPVAIVEEMALRAKAGWDIAAHLCSVAPALERALQIDDAFRRILGALKSLFPVGLDLEALRLDGDLEGARFALEANLPDGYAPHPALTDLEAVAGTSNSPLHARIASLREAIGSEETNPNDLVRERGGITEEIVRLRGLAERLSQVEEDLQALAQAGAPAWSEQLKQNPLDAARVILPTWCEAWEWARMAAKLDDVIQRGNGDAERQRKADALRRRERLQEELIRVRTLLGLKQRMRPSLHRALLGFTQAVAKLGKGTGKNAPRYRAAAQSAAKEAAVAAPVWIMPEYRIPEQLPAAVDDFDLVILDEASQSDITAVSAIARGKQALIVGDEEQVSPSNIGIPIQRINALRAEFLHGLPNASLIDENTSIFEITMRMYPHTHIVLREHFRSVAPIIQFSTQFYANRLIPLRIPKPSERFDPPLVDIFIDRAHRKGKTNPDEARFIVEEIARIIADPAHAHRDIGVVSLIGSEQAQLIESMLIDDKRVGPETISERRLVCGDARTMQGQERSIMFLSMVAVPGQVVSQTTKDTQQRLNVAMSRARDRVYLVRSVGLKDLKKNDLKRKVVEHFLDPMPEGRVDTDADILDRCDSDFECEVLGMLLDAGYRARPQVKAGAFSIDIVVEGADDRRLAIELDGDRYHGPDVWERDMARQAALERAGWVFWRVFGSQWRAQREYWWNDLKDTLDGMGIETIGAEAVNDAFVDYKWLDARADLAELQPSPAAEPAADETVASGDVPRDATGETPAERSTPAAPDLFAAPGRPSPVASSEAASSSSITVGSRVRVEIDDSEKLEIQLVRADPNPDEGRIGIHTPLGSALLEATIGEEVEYMAGEALRTVRVVEISNPS